MRVKRWKLTARDGRLEAASETRAYARALSIGTAVAMRGRARVCIRATRTEDSAALHSTAVVFRTRPSWNEAGSLIVTTRHVVFLALRRDAFYFPLFDRVDLILAFFFFRQRST